MSARNPSGELHVKQDAIVYSVPDGGGWQVPIIDIRVIGEFTNDHGPAIDDYFFVLVAREEYFEASFYADGRDEFLAQLGRRLSHPLRPSLSSSTQLASRVLWPARLEGRPLFSLIPEQRAGSVVGRLRQHLLPRVHMHLTDEVREVLQS